MRIGPTILVAALLAVTWLPSVGIAAESNGMKVTLRLPEKVTLGLDLAIPICIEAVSSDGKPISGDTVDVWADYGRFLLPNNATTASPVSVQLTDGRGSATLSMGSQLEFLHEQRIHVTRGPYGQQERLASATIDIRYPAPVVVPKASIYRAKANGIDRPVFTAVIHDQKGQPIPGLDVRFICGGLDSPDSFNIASDSTGRVIAKLAARRKPGTEFFQIMVGEHVSQPMRVTYAEADPPLVSLQDAARRAKAKLSFDSGSVTGAVKGQGIDLRVRSGESIAWLNGDPVPMGGAAVLKGGSLWIPEDFAAKTLER